MSNDNSAARAPALFIDTGAFFARFYARATRHALAQATFQAIGGGDLAYRAVYTSGYVLGELARLLLYKADRETATGALAQIRESPAVTVLHPDRPTFADAVAGFDRYDDQDVTLVDHLSAVLVHEYDVEHVFTFDEHDFRVFGADFTLVPADIEVPEHD